MPWQDAYMIGEWMAVPGTIFLGLIQMVIVPLVACSIILGISESANLQFLRNMGAKVVLYFIATTTVSITIGLALVHFIKPGLYI